MVIYYLFKFQYATGICLLLENVVVSEQQQETPELFSPDLWPPNSLDLNPVDYQIWGWMQEHVYRTPVRDTDDLKRRLIDTWARIPQSVVDGATDQWTIRLRACEKARGRHFEHLL